jgi:transcriptional regulator with XRE-family HTH domain
VRTVGLDLDACRWLGLKVRETRLSVRWTQGDLGRAVAVSQSAISEIERGLQPELTIRRVESLLVAMGARLAIDVRPPRLAAAALGDPVHARCCHYAVRRLERSGWLVRTEVEVGGNRSRGWIDVLAFHPSTRMVVVIECKTEIRDLGDIERTLHWYEREAPTAARRYGWNAVGIASVLLLLASDACDGTAREYRDVLARIFPARSQELTTIVASGEAPIGTRGLAMIDPRARGHEWLRPLRVDGRRRPAPYRDYLDCLRLLQK